MKTIIFSDLDGSLLDHEDYSYEAARPALELIQRKGLPLVPVTSKTRVEVEKLQRDMGIDMPFVVENGGAIFFPPDFPGSSLPDSVPVDRYRAVVLGKRYPEIRDFLGGLPEHLGIFGFGDMTDQEVAALTDLPLGVARLARMREFTEPFVIEQQESLEELRVLASRAGMRITTGGRLHHLMGEGQDKGRAVERVIRSFRELSDETMVSIGLGDGPNDVPMLQRVDFAVLIPNLRGRPVRLQREGLIRARFPGSRGWNQAVLEILERILPATPGDG
jgi:mannosyl-3-phosphoglycerate phosphatase